MITHACRVIVLEDNDLVHLRGDTYEIFNAGGRRSAGGAGGSPRPLTPVRRVLHTLEMEVSQIMKVG